MSNILSVLDSGSNGVLINIETHLSNSLPNIVIVGFASKSVDEAKERIRGALANSNIKIPKKRITINLAPADIPKEGSYFDLAILVSILTKAHIVEQSIDDKIVILGELSLDGFVRPVRGVIGKILMSKKLGIDTFWIPEENLDQASLVPDIKILPIKNIAGLYKMLLNKNYRESYIKTGSLSPIEQNTPASNIVLDDIIGQEIAKRALVIAVAGNHNIMLNGAPGAGKSMLAKAMPSIMPPLQQNEILEITHIHSLANKNFEKIIRERPFRSPHHTSSNTSIIGGGQKPKPGEISLSHHGVLLFDEFPEFSRSIIESLRQPLEDKVITVARAKDSIDFPANFLLVATSNPCPCGYFGSKKECTCTPTQILKYQRKTSGPIMDRIDLYIDVEEIDNSKLVASKNSTEYLKIRKNVEEARNIQYTRANKLNSELNNKELSKFANLEGPAQHILEIAGAQMNLSARAYLRSLKVARTIADLEKSEKILPKHITEALQYRKRSSEF